MKKLIGTLNEDQRTIFDKMAKVNKLQICLPTGVGRGYLMGVDLKNRLTNGENLITIASHRLILNNQHMDDIISRLSDMIQDVRFIFIGSSVYNHQKLQDSISIKKQLYKYKLTSDEVIQNSLSKKELDNKVDSMISDGKKVILVSTYHSLSKLNHLEIDTLYCDEAHTLASTENNSVFEQNFKSINTKNIYFFTATPKDCTEDDGSFLMNNNSVFGERVGMDMKDAIIKGYITKPIIHIAIPHGYEHEDMDNITNKVKFIIDCFNVHTDLVKESSSNPELIEPKFLIKCESVDIMWVIYSKLLESNLTDVKLFAGASRKGVNGSSSYEENGIKIDKIEHLLRLKSLKNDEKAIVLHVDTLSEGVNVKGFTGVMFLTDQTPTTIKLLQNIGRGTRVLNIDRENFNLGKINTSDYIGWVKPNTFVILPIYNPSSEASQYILADSIKKFRDKSGESVYKVSIGNDLGKGRDDSEDSLIDKMVKDVRKKIVEEIDHQIEKLYIDEIEIEESNRLNNLSNLELLKEKFGNPTAEDC